jgi:hypothetical protein
VADLLLVASRSSQAGALVAKSALDKGSRVFHNVGVGRSECSWERQREHEDVREQLHCRGGLSSWTCVEGGELRNDTRTRTVGTKRTRPLELSGGRMLGKAEALLF